MFKSLPVRRTGLSVLLIALLAAGCGEKPEAMLSSAKEFIAKKDNKAAIIQIKNYLQKVPDSVEARYLLGRSLMEVGDLTSAEVELRKALELKYPPDLVIPPLANVMLARGQAKKVIADFAKMDLGTPTAQADLLSTVAVAYSSLGDVPAFQSTVAAALQAKSDHLPALILQARVRAGAKDYDGAFAILDRVLAADSKNSGAWKLKGDVAQAKQGGDGGMEFYRKAVEMRPEFASAHVAIIQLLLKDQKLDEAGKQIDALKKVAPRNPQALFLGASYAYLKKDYKASRDLLQQLHKLTQGAPLSFQLAGAVDFATGAFASAEENLTKALQLSPDLPAARMTLINTYLQMGQPTKALAALQPIMGRIEGDANLLSLAGAVYDQMGDMKQAEDYYAKAAKLDPKDTTKRTRLALAHLAKGDAEALDELEDIAAADPSTTASQALVNAYLRRNQVDKAVQTADALAKKTPNDPIVQYLLGRALVAKKDTAGARGSFEKAVAQSPGFFPAAASLAALDLTDKKPDEARRRFEKVLAADEKNVQALLALAGLTAQNKGKPEEVLAILARAVAANPTDTAPRLALIEEHMRQKDIKKALAASQDALAAIPENPDVLMTTGRVYLAAGEHNQALVSFNKVASLQPNSGIPYFRIAEVQLAMNDREATIKSLRRAIEIKPDFLEAQRTLAVQLAQLDRYDAAIAVARQIQKQRPKEAVGFVSEGDLALMKKRWPDAVRAYRAAAERAAGVTEVAIKLHAALAGSGDKAGAEKFSSQWRKTNPKDTGFQLHLADTALAQQDYAGAVQQYQALLTGDPDNVLALNNLAWASGKLKDPKALEYAEKANKLAPDQPPLMDTLAVLLAARGDTAKAIELLRKALQLAPQAGQIRLSLAKVLVQAGQKAEARKELEALGKLGNNFPAQAEVAKLLKEI